MLANVLADEATTADHVDLQGAVGKRWGDRRERLVLLSSLNLGSHTVQADRA
jgi:hypothetical protein